MQQDVAFKVKVESGGFMATQMAVRKQTKDEVLAMPPMGISKKRLGRFKKAFEARWLKEQLDSERKMESGGSGA
jgi:hypothetical protein